MNKILLVCIPILLCIGCNENKSYETVFNDPQKLKKLNNLVHPRVKEDYLRWVEAHRKQQYVLKEAALLFEAGSSKELDKIIVVHAPEELRIKRVLARDAHRTEELVKEIIKNQMKEDDKMNRADFIVYNDETQLLIPQILKLHQTFVVNKA